MVFIPEADRGTLCISSQVGCALDCSFCSTAQAGIQPQSHHCRNRRPGVAREARAGDSQAGRTIALVTNVVLMGMGEPLANFRNVRAGAAHPAG